MSETTDQAGIGHQRVSISFTFLSGIYYAASRVGERSDPEWPPHFGRAFMAMVASLYRWSRPSDDPGFLAERDALLALEKLPPPAIHAPPATPTSLPEQPVNAWEADQPVSVYVRRNHLKGMSGAAAGRLLPWSQHGKVARFFPGMLLQVKPSPPNCFDPLPEVHFLWAGADAQEILRVSEPLRRLLQFVTYLGTSRSLVFADLSLTPPAPTHRPLMANERPSTTDISIRVAGEGRLKLLEDHFELRKRSEVPPVGESHLYRQVQGDTTEDRTQPVCSTFGDQFVFRLEGRDWLHLTKTLLVTHHFRATVLSFAGEGGREAVVNGHGEDPDDIPDHIAWIPLANVGYEHSNGRILGVATILPRSLDPGTSGRCVALAALGALRVPLEEGTLNLQLGELGCPRVRTTTGTPALSSLDTRRYSATARVWASVTPFVSELLGVRDNHDSRRLVRRACRTVGLPAPLDCVLTRISPLRGVPPADHFIAKRKPEDPDCRCRHVIIDFGRPVRGPIMIGRYRYFGMGLCLPWNPTREVNT